jgi:hypothetical protein
MQEPAGQTSAAGHRTPHTPQLFLSVWKLVQSPLQKSGLARVGQAQRPLWQVSAAAQACPHVPQLLRSVPWTFVHALPQKSGFALVGHAQWPPWQTSAAGHTAPVPEHVPQCFGSRWRSVHSLLQWVKPAWQVVVHTPALQSTSGSACGSLVVQTFPQAPVAEQLARSVRVFVHAGSPAVGH